MAKGSSFNPLQLVSPAMLVFCLILFFLPWIELSCSLPPEATKNAPKEQLEEFKKKSGLDPTRSIGMFTQSGLQIATGDFSLSSDMEKLEKQMKDEMGGGGKSTSKAEKEKDKEKGDTAPLMYLFPVALLAGIGFGVAPWPHPSRKFVAAGCCALAFGVVGIQAIIGFPLEKEIAKQKEKTKGLGAMLGGGGGGDTKGKDAKEPEIFKVRWKLPLYLTLVLLLGATGTALLPASPAPKKKRRYDDDDDYDDEEDDYDPPPRKKKRRDDEEDEDRPRKRRRDDDDEEDDRPRKKKRYDDEDEDDRPRKKAKRPEPVVEDLPDDDHPPPPPPKAKPAARPAAPPPAPPALPPEPSGAPNPFAFDDEPAPKKKPKRRDDDDYDDEDDRPRKRR